MKPFQKILMVVGLSCFGVVANASAAKSTVRSVVKFGDKVVITTVRTQLIKSSEFVSSTSAQSLVGPHGEWSLCRVMSTVEVGTVEASIQIQDLTGMVVETREVAQQPLILNMSRDDLNDPECRSAKATPFESAASSGFVINEFFGSRFGRPESALQLAVEASVKSVSVGLNQKGVLAPQLEKLSVYDLRINGVSAFYYVSAEDQAGLPTLKPAESSKLAFDPIPEPILN
jgi:hypothetical protein